MGQSTLRPHDNLRNQDIPSDLLEEYYFNDLHTPGVHLIHNMFWQYPLCNVYRFWQPDELHQLVLGLVKDLLHWLLKYLKA
jgi:hypothetical protein